jgi:Ca-activated chloride channel family protein
MMDIIGQFHFIRPLALLLAPLAAVLWWVLQRRSDPLRGWREQMDPDLLDALVIGRDSQHRGGAAWLLAAWLVAVVGIAGPTWRLEPSPFAEDATPLMILLKADQSMDRPDPAPSRIERARLKISDLAEARKGQPLGLIAYAGSAHLVLPPTRDTATVASMAAEISPDIMPRSGDRLDLAVLKAGDVLKDTGGTLLVIADSADGGSEGLANAARSVGLELNILAISAPDSSESESLRTAAKALDGKVQELTVDDSDIRALVRRAARTPVARTGAEGDRWQEAGWYLVPIVALISALSFRREVTTEQEAAEA